MSANRDGLVAVGGDLSVERLVLAYRSGIFPWPIFDDDLMTWFSPDPRAVLDLEALRINRTLQKALRKPGIRVTYDESFSDVIDACAAAAPGRMSTWITPQLQAAYCALHQRGHAHSVEVWSNDVLIGGLYGVAISGLFAGESMFSRESNASKIALVHLVERLRARGYALLDIQQSTPHMMKLGASLISRREYLRRLEGALSLNCVFD
ncbi:MAG: leucyl/phenylalanyl-tRNA--protein transferase [Deltaproteobacteria bacterium]